MALDKKVGSFSSAAGTQTITVGFQPKALLFFARAKYGANDHMITHGFATGVNNQGCTTSCGDYYSGYDRGGILNTHAIWLISNDPATREQGRVSAIGATGFDITWDTYTSSRTIYYVALGGSDLANAAAGALVYSGTANYAETGLGFQPDCLLGLGYNRDDAVALTFGDNPRPIGITTGFALSPADQHSFGAQSSWNSDTDSTSGHKVGSIIVIPGRSSGIDVDVTLQSFDAGGFTLAKGTGTEDVGIVYLALKGLQYNIGVNQQPTTVGDQALTGFGFPPQLLLAHHAGNANADGVFTEPEARGFGAGDGTVMGAVSQVSALNSYQFGSRLDTNQIITTCAVGDSIVASASLKSLDADGITLNWTTADTVVRNFGWLAIGPAAAGGGAHDLIVGDISSAASSDDALVIQTQALAAADASAGSFADAAALAQPQQLSATDMVAVSATDAPAAQQTNALTISAASASTVSDLIAITQSHAVTIDGAASQAAADDVGVSMGVVTDLTIADMSAAATVDDASIAQQHASVISGAVGQASASDVSASYEHAIILPPSYADAEAEMAAVTQQHIIFVDGAASAATIDEPSLITGGLGVITDPSLISLTKQRTMNSMTKQRTIKQL